MAAVSLGATGVPAATIGPSNDLNCIGRDVFSQRVTVPLLRLQVALTGRLRPCHRHAGWAGRASASAQGNWPGFGRPGTGPDQGGDGGLGTASHGSVGVAGSSGDISGTFQPPEVAIENEDDPQPDENTWLLRVFASEPPTGIEPMTCALPEACSLAPIA
jgi:hypothetical protein